MKNTTLYLLLLLATNLSASLPAVTGSRQPGCDTLLTTDGKTYVCQILRQDGREIQFSLCDDASGTVYAVPQQRIAAVRKAQAAEKPLVVKALKQKRLKTTSAAASPKKAPAPKRVRTPEEEANTALTRGIFSFMLSISLIFSPIGFIVGIAAISKGRKVLQMLKGKPGFRKLRRKARWAIWLSTAGMVLSLGFILWILHALLTWEGIGPFDFNLYTWCATC